MRLPRLIRLLLAYGLGDDDRRVPQVPDGFPLDVGLLVAENVRLLTEYQDADYARLYLSRLGRFVGRRGIDERMLGEIARLLAMRMAYEDLIWHAQLALMRGMSGPGVSWQAAPRLPDNLKCVAIKPTLREVVSMFPALVARPMISALALSGWTDTVVPVSLTTHTWHGRLVARIMTLLRRLRPQSVRYSQEKPLVERWLHMVDRALTKQPAAVWEVIETATLLNGLGEQYRCSLANWHLMIDGLAKPTFDGDLPLADLGERLSQLRVIAASDLSGHKVRQEIANIKAGLAHAV